MKFSLSSFLKIGALFGVVGGGVLAGRKVKGALEAKAKAHEEEFKYQVAFTSGSMLSIDKVEELEIKLASNPDSLKLRTILQGYYFFNLRKDTRLDAKYAENTLWIIENCPDIPLATTFFQLKRFSQPDYYERGKKLWLQHVENNPDNPFYFRSAAEYLDHEDMDLEEELLIQGMKLDPKNCGWYSRLAFIYNLKGKGSEPECSVYSKKALEYAEEAVYLAPIREKHEHMLKLPEIAYQAGNFKLAKNVCREAFVASKFAKAIDGRALHKVNTIYGLIVLKEGNLKAARKSLLNSAKVEPECTLKSFGPSMRLAKVLLAKGEGDCVIEYLELCSDFWKPETCRKWIEEIREGNIPEEWQKERMW